MTKNILYVNNTDPEDGGGGDRRLFEEAMTLEEMGNVVTVIASRTDPELDQRRVSNGVQIRTVKCVPDFFYRSPTLHFYLSRSLFPLLSLPILLKAFLSEEFDIVVDNHTPHLSLAPLLGLFVSFPVVALVHEYHDRSALEKYPLPVGLIQLLVQNSLRTGLYAAVIVPREQTKNELQRYGVQSPIYVVPNGIEFETYAEPPESADAQSFDLFVVSRLVHRKGVDQLLRAMAVVVDERPSTRLGIAGAGTERDTLEALAADLGIESNVSFLGFVSEERKRGLLHEATVFVLPSRQEGFGIAVLEAMATGTPVVTNDLDVLRQLVPAETNRLADASDPDAFGSALVDVLETEEDVLRAAGKQNKQEAERYSLERVGREATTVYDRVCGHSQTASQ